MREQEQRENIKIRFAGPKDVPILYSFICELAEYERLRHEVISMESDIYSALFGERPVAEALLAFYEDKPAGFALFFHSFSTFVGKPGIYLEDLYVKPEMRRKGIGRDLLARVARIAVERKCGRLEWAVLNWNTPSIQFYESLGAQPLDEWTVYRIVGENLEALAAEFENDESVSLR